MGISPAQVLLDGNRRTACHAAATCLLLNGVSVTVVDALEMARQLEAGEERTDTLAAATEQLEAWRRVAAGTR